jgi:hypothetical protein
LPVGQNRLSSVLATTVLSLGQVLAASAKAG